MVAACVCRGGVAIAAVVVVGVVQVATAVADTVVSTRVVEVVVGGETAVVIGAGVVTVGAVADTCYVTYILVLGEDVSIQVILNTRLRRMAQLSFDGSFQCSKAAMHNRMAHGRGHRPQTSRGLTTTSVVSWAGWRTASLRAAATDVPNGVFSTSSTCETF